MAEERKIGVSFSFSKRKPAIKSYSSEKNALSIDEDKVKDDEKDYIHSAEEKELKRYISVACSPPRLVAGQFNSIILNDWFGLGFSVKVRTLYRIMTQKVG